MIRINAFAGFLSFILVALPGIVAAKDSHDSNTPVQVVYVIVTPNASTGLAVFETFGELAGDAVPRAAVLPPNMTNSAMLFASSRCIFDFGNFANL